MFKSIDLSREYTTKEEMFNDVFKNRDKIISFKKSIVYKSIDKGQVAEFNNAQTTVKGIDTKDGYIYPVINTTNFLDSHLDNHQKSIWNKSAKEQLGKIRYSLDHSTKVADVIAYPNDVEIKLIDTTFEDLGTEYKGETRALVFAIKEAVIDNEVALKVINKRLPVQNSVSMQYVDITLAMDSTAKEHKKEKKEWDDNINNVANKDFANEQGVMWLVKEAKIINESSMVTQGSNSATPIVYGNTEAAKNSTSQHNEPSDDTHQDKSSNNLLNFL